MYALMMLLATADPSGLYVSPSGSEGIRVVRTDVGWLVTWHYPGADGPLSGKARWIGVARCTAAWEFAEKGWSVDNPVACYSVWWQIDPHTRALTYGGSTYLRLP